jgi:hypothetical protein
VTHRDFISDEDIRSHNPPGCDIIVVQKFVRKLSQAVQLWMAPNSHLTWFMIACRNVAGVNLPDLSDDDYSPRRSAKGKDGRHIEAILRTFKFEKSVAWDALTHHFSAGIRHRELCSIALVLSHCFGFPTISRDARRSYPVLIKWFHDHWPSIEPVMPLVALRDEEDGIIDHHRQPPGKH